MIKKLIYIGFILRLLNAAWNGFWGPSFGAESDAVGYFIKATEYSINLVFIDFVMGDLYAYFLGLLFYLTTPSVFLGSLTSCFAWLTSAFILKNMLDILEINKKQYVMIIYVFLPSSIIFSSVTLRETFQLLFVNLSIYSVLMISITNKIKYWVLMTLSVVGMGVLHGALLAFGFYVICASIGSRNYLRNKIGSKLAIAIVGLIFLFGFSYFSDLMNSVSYQLGDIAVNIESYQSSAINMDARSNYKFTTHGTQWELVSTLPYTLFQFLFEPMPWRITSPIDFIALGENILRAYLIYCSFSIFKGHSNQFTHFHKFVFISWVVISLIWSIGTVNWGTSMRHQIPSMAMLLLSAYASSPKNTKQQVPSRL